MKKNYILDACAVIAAIKQENGAMTVAEIYEEAYNNNANLIMNKVNLLEVYYGFRKENGQKFADDMLLAILNSIVEISDISINILKEAGRIKSENGRISLADAIALAETVARNGFLVTSDHHEMDNLEKKHVAQFIWFR